MRETFVIWDAEWRRTVRSGRAVVLLGLYSMFSALVLLIVGSIARQLREQVELRLSEQGGDAAMANQVYAEAQKGVLGFLARNDPAMMEALGQVPLVVLVVFKLTLFFLPAYIALMGFDQISGEVGPRSIRYLTVRARRSSLLLGRFLSQATVLLGLVLVVDLIVFVYAKVTTPDFTAAAFTVNLLKFWLAAIVFSLAYLALTTFCSALFRASAVSLAFNFIGLFTFWLMDTVGGLVSEGSPLSYVRYLSPSYYSTDLLHPRLSHFGVSGVAYTAFALLFLGGAHFVLRARDV